MWEDDFEALQDIGLGLHMEEDRGFREDHLRSMSGSDFDEMLREQQELADLRKQVEIDKAQGKHWNQVRQRKAAAAKQPARPVKRAVADPIEEYKLQLGDEIRRFMIDKAADEGPIYVGDAQMMRSVPLVEMRKVYKDMLNRGFRRI